MGSCRNTYWLVPADEEIHSERAVFIEPEILSYRIEDYYYNGPQVLQEGAMVRMGVLDVWCYCPLASGNWSVLRQMELIDNCVETGPRRYEDVEVMGPKAEWFIFQVGLQ